MSNFKGTQGRWIVGEGIPNGIEDLKGNIQVISNCDYKWEIACIFKDVNFSDEDNIAQHNAKLIACAPEMLEMLGRVIKEHKTDTKSWSTIIEIEQLIKKATEL